MALPANEYPTWAASFRFRDFRLLCGSTVIYALGQGMEMVALGWLVFDITNSPFLVGVAYAANMAPLSILGILSGAISDRLDRRVLYRFISLSAGVVASTMALILLAGVAQVSHIIVLAVAAGGVFAFNQSIRAAYTYDIVGPGRALSGLSLIMIGQRVGHLTGALLAGLVISIFGAGIQYAVISAVYVAAFAILLGTRGAGHVAPRRRETVLQNLAGYIELIRRNRTLLSLMLLTVAVESLGWTHDSLLPVFAKDVLGVDAVGLGIMAAGGQVGGILGLALLAGLGDHRRKGLLTFLAIIAFGLGLMFLAPAPNLLSILAVLAAVNAIGSTLDVVLGTLMQNSVSNEQRGRAMGSYVLGMGVAPLGHLEVGWVAGLLGAPSAVLINGGVLVLVGLASAIGLPRIRRLE